MHLTRRNSLLLYPIFTFIVPVSAFGDHMLALQDAIVAPDGKTRLVAYLIRESLFGIPKDIEHTEVRFFLGDHQLGSSNSGEEGMAVLECAIPDDSSLEFRAEATYSGEVMRGTARLFRWKPDKVIICVDIDDTISRTDLDDVFFDEEDEDSRPLRQSPETLQNLAEDYEILYLTARNSSLIDLTRKWLAQHGFPAAPVVVSHRKRDLLQQAEYKERILRALQKTWPNILIGIGDKGSDAEAYGERDMLTIIVLGKKRNNVGRHALIMPDWKTIQQFFKNNRQVLTNPKRCRLAIAGDEPLLQNTNRYRKDEDD